MYFGRIVVVVAFVTLECLFEIIQCQYRKQYV